MQETFLQNENGDPIFCGEELIKHVESGELDAGAVFTKAVAEVYSDIYFALTEGRAMRITPEMAAEIIAVIDKVHCDNPLPLIY